jgi:WhiB family redox-sensing transcriptional regulator
LVRSVPLDGGASPHPDGGTASGRPDTPDAALGTLLDAALHAGLDLPCRSGDADLWFAESPAELERAKALCVDCPVRIPSDPTEAVLLWHEALARSHPRSR